MKTILVNCAPEETRMAIVANDELLAVEVEREYVNALQGWSLRAPAGALEAIRGANGVKSAYLDGEMRVQ